MIMHRTEGALVQNVIDRNPQNPQSPDDQPVEPICNRNLWGYPLWKWIVGIVSLNIILIVIVVCVLTFIPQSDNAVQLRGHFNKSSSELSPLPDPPI
ncbi:hypothetical protein AVEN_219058-1 [Araneus ventricosus]|uniref:Uncharacterized protein n=1 Tax=Araneus ventricosus TaxID=182803 RepID=A0A4Y2FHE7_ARAVE|nr:hypothetical protein AVEN_68110-1 [Araneus ventricosus]GBM40447.1 hypothetical protein AVEN_88494-1 [Araneus ventricosus]GBM40466.1 hypothetical protein AVEN_115593-1 [Araneus ventricosus]GBM40557.1 hypothetical protein AVEN_219058-1 [Araneus ventricosus]